MSINRSNIHKPILAISVVLLLVGFSGLFGPKTTGLGKGFGAVFFVLFFICNLLKNEKTDDELRAADLRGSVDEEEAVGPCKSQAVASF